MSTWKNKGFAKLSVLSWFSSPKIVGKSSKNDNLNNLKRTEKSAGRS